MKIFLTGASGMLANDVIPVLEKNGHSLVKVDIKPRLKDIQKCDISDYHQALKSVEESRPDYIFHLAAETDVDRCEREPDHAFRVNTLGTENMVLACQRVGCKLLYISTAGVFSGDKPTAYTEFDQPGPINVYGQSKLEGEIVVQRFLDHYFIVRAGWMVGGWEIDKKFVYKMVQQIQQGRKELRVVNDKVGSLTFTKDFAANILNVINTGRYGIYHMTNQGTCSRYEMALKIVEFMGKKDQVAVIPINSAEFSLPAQRSRSEMMQNYKLELLELNRMPYWEESLKRYIMENTQKVGTAP